MSKNFDTIIVGGGLVGAALACGIAARGHRVAVRDIGRFSARPPLKPITLGQLAETRELEETQHDRETV